ncbi:ATP-binding protein [Catenulispora yoronensis]
MLDHLAARMTRNNESLLVLGGEGTARVRDEGVPLIDVIRAASGRIERYSRVDLVNVDSSVIVAPTVVDHLVHLCAELLDNATTFSPPESRVLVDVRALADRTIIQITDRGIGMTAVRRSELNARLTAPTRLDAVSVQAMGLTVVGQLAAWYGLAVELRPHPQHGTIAELVLPPNLYWAPGMPERAQSSPVAAIESLAAGMGRPGGENARPNAGIRAAAAAAESPAPRGSREPRADGGGAPARRRRTREPVREREPGRARASPATTATPARRTPAAGGRADHDADDGRRLGAVRHAGLRPESARRAAPDAGGERRVSEHWLPERHLSAGADPGPGVRRAAEPGADGFGRSGRTGGTAAQPLAAGLDAHSRRERAVQRGPEPVGPEPVGPEPTGAKLVHTLVAAASGRCVRPADLDPTVRAGDRTRRVLAAAPAGLSRSARTVLGATRHGTGLHSLLSHAGRATVDPVAAAAGAVAAGAAVGARDARGAVGADPAAGEAAHRARVAQAGAVGPAAGRGAGRADGGRRGSDGAGSVAGLGLHGRLRPRDRGRTAPGGASQIPYSPTSNTGTY